jgi:hypothetical protein
MIATIITGGGAGSNGICAYIPQRSSDLLLGLLLLALRG